jgi:hypothetical protein
MKKDEEFQDLLEQFIENPQMATNHLVLGMDKEQRQQARGLSNGKSVPHWF